MKQPALIIEKSHDLAERPILVVDKNGKLGDKLVEQLKNDGIIIYVSKEMPVLEEKNFENVIHIPFHKRIPTIPENNYSYIFVVDDNAILREAAASFLRKAEEDKAALIFITSLFEVSERIIREIKDNYKGARVIVYGDIFGESLPDKISSPANKLIYEAVKYGRKD